MSRIKSLEDIKAPHHMISDVRKGGDNVGVHCDDGSEKGFYGSGGKSLGYDLPVGYVICIWGERYNSRSGMYSDCFTFKLNGKRIGYDKLAKLMKGS